MTVQAKICGISTTEALDAVIAGGASHVGLNFFPKSPRYVNFEHAASFAARTSGRTRVVGLFVNPEIGEVLAACRIVSLQTIQLHGSESPEFVAQIGAATGLDVWKAVPIRTKADLQQAAAYHGAASHILYDAKPPKGADLPGGNGLRFDWTLLDGHAHPLPWWLSGGLDSANLAEAVSVTAARNVDVSSGVETGSGIKDVDKIAAFLKAAAQL